VFALWSVLLLFCSPVARCVHTRHSNCVYTVVTVHAFLLAHPCVYVSSSSSDEVPHDRYYYAGHVNNVRSRRVKKKKQSLFFRTKFVSRAAKYVRCVHFDDVRWRITVSHETRDLLPGEQIQGGGFVQLRRSAATYTRVFKRKQYCLVLVLFLNVRENIREIETIAPRLYR